MRFAAFSLLLLLAASILAYSQEANVSLVQQRMEKWEFRTNDFVDSSPAIGESAVFVGSADKNLYAFDPVNGRERWRFRTNGSIESTPAYSRGAVYFGSNDNSVYALNATTGHLIWQANTSGKVYSSPAAVGGVVYVGSVDGLIYALNATTGETVWGFNTSGQVFSSPAISVDYLYVGSTNGYLYALNATSGAEIWAYEAGSAIYSSPRVVNNLVYFGAYNNMVYALSAFDGTKTWEFAASDKVLSSPAVGRGIIWVGSSDGKLYALNAFDGGLLWTFETGNPVDSSPFYSARNNAVYFGSKDNYVYALNASSGELLWKYRTGDDVTSSPVLYGGVLYVGSYDKKFYALSTMSTFITYPESGQDLNGTTVTITGFSVADAGVRTTEIKLGSDPTWRTVLGTANWTYTWGIANIAPGSYLIKVRTTDNNGDVEIEPNRQISVSIRQPPHAFDKPLAVEYPPQLRPGDWVRITVRDEQGNPIPYPKIVLDGVPYYGDANGLVSTDPNGNPIIVTKSEGELLFTVEKTGYFVPEGTRLAITIYREDYTPYIALIAVIVIGAVAFYVWKKRQEPGYV